MGINDKYLSFEERVERGEKLDEHLNLVQIATLWSGDHKERKKLMNIMRWEFMDGALKGVDITEPTIKIDETSDMATKAFWAFEKQKLDLRFSCYKFDPDYSYLIIEVSKNDFLSWLESSNEPKPTGCLLERWWNENRPSHKTINTYDNATDQGRRDRQIKAICDKAKLFGYDVLNIPEGGKKAIRTECLKIENGLFTPDGFKKAWSQASTSGKISMANKEKYLSKQ
ncbi:MULTISPECIES: hypothetical protein [Methylomonas]|uniref:Uncharacterized protein n=1 Tax=Methylomonas koyamae TaxID=702114 RepID=A0A177NKM1_9GAMM|nr:hypothetical protein [Methylomonas koyamae]OAI17739.1 hypothetical protein A1355_07170 [Methylomonas koyamae]